MEEFTVMGYKAITVVKSFSRGSNTGERRSSEVQHLNTFSGSFL